MSKEFDDIKEFGNRRQHSRKLHMKYQNNDANEEKLKKLWAVLGLLIIVLIIALIATNCGGNSDNKKDEESKLTTKETTVKQEETTAAGPELVSLSEDNEVYKLILSYIDAAYVQCNVEMLESIMDSVENVNIDKNTVRQRYIEAYNDITCYVLDGKDNISVVFVSYNVKLYNYDVLLPAGETLKIVKMEDGTYKIHNIEVGEQFESHMINEKQVEELAVLQEKIQSEYNAVIEGNSEIKSIVDILNGAKTE